MLTGKLPASLCALGSWKSKKMKFLQALFYDELFILQKIVLRPSFQMTIILWMKLICRTTLKIQKLMIYVFNWIPVKYIVMPPKFLHCVWERSKMIRENLKMLHIKIREGNKLLTFLVENISICENVSFHSYFNSTSLEKKMYFNFSVLNLKWFRLKLTVKDWS